MTNYAILDIIIVFDFKEQAFSSASFVRLIPVNRLVKVRVLCELAFFPLCLSFMCFITPDVVTCSMNMGSMNGRCEWAVLAGV